MAAQNAPQCKPAAADCAKAQYRLLGIGGTGGFEAAMRAQQWAYKVPVTTNEEDQDAAHCCINSCQCHSRLRRSPGLSITAAGGLAWTTISTDGSLVRCLRKLSRTWRLMRLRTLASATALRATLMPNRAASGLGLAYTRKQESVVRVPVRKARLKSAGVRSRAAGENPFVDELKGRVSPGPWRDGHSAPGVHVLLPYARETHGYASGECYWVDRFFSCW